MKKNTAQKSSLKSWLIALIVFAVVAVIAVGVSFIPNANNCKEVALADTLALSEDIVYRLPYTYRFTPVSSTSSSVRLGYQGYFLIAYQSQDHNINETHVVNFNQIACYVNERTTDTRVYIKFYQGTTLVLQMRFDGPVNASQSDIFTLSLFQFVSINSSYDISSAYADYYYAFKITNVSQSSALPEDILLSSIAYSDMSLVIASSLGWVSPDYTSLLSTDYTATNYFLEEVELRTIDIVNGLFFANIPSNILHVVVGVYIGGSIAPYLITVSPNNYRYIFAVALEPDYFASEYNTISLVAGDSDVYTFTSQGASVNGSTMSDFNETIYDRGYDLGYNVGYSDAIVISSDNQLVDVIWATIQMPVRILFGEIDTDPLSPTHNQYVGGLFNFTILGLDIRAFVLSVMSVCIIVAIMKIVVKFVI